MTFLLYASLLLLQLKRVWGMWNLRDLTGGDTSVYFLEAFRSFSEGKASFAWSPIYTAFFGSLFHLSPDAYVVVTLHRLLILLVACLLVHAVFRQLVSPPVAWLAAAWWAWLPVNFDTMYEVHLFSALLPLLALWCALRFPSSYGRAAAFGLIVLLSVLQRNEYAVAALVIVAGFWLVQGRPRWSRAVIPYLLAAAAAVAVSAIGLWRSHLPLTALTADFHSKHTLNLCQTYAFGYQHRNPTYTAFTWLECHDLMKATFGQPMPTFFQAARTNPRAIATHIGWNFLPAGGPLGRPRRHRRCSRPDPVAQVVLPRSSTAACSRPFRRWFPLLAVAILVLTPSYCTLKRFPDRPLYRLYERLASNRPALPQRNTSCC